MALRPIWKIQNLTKGTPPMAFMDLGFSELHIGRRRQAISTATWNSDGSKIDDPFTFNFNDFCLITLNGVGWFAGFITQPKGTAQSNVEQALAYELSNSWWQLAERATHQQWWYYRNDWFPRVILGEGVIWPANIIYKQTADEVIVELLEFAIEQLGVPIQIGHITAGPEIPWTERTSLLSGEGIKMMIQWMGGCVDCWDYTTTKIVGGVAVPCPTFNLYSLAECTPKSISILDKRIARMPEVSPCYRLQLPVVCMYYETKNTDDDESDIVITKDIFPVGANPLQLGALLPVIELAGSVSVYQKSNVQTAEIPDGTDAGKLMTWIASRCPELNGLVNPANLNFVAGSYVQTVDANQTDVNGNQMINFQPSDLPRELLDKGGGIMSWMAKPAPNPPATGSTQPDDDYIHSGNVTITAMITYDYEALQAAPGPNAVNELDQAQRIFGSSDGINIRVTYRGTNARSIEYKQISSATDPEPTPRGISKQLWESYDQLYRNGTLQLDEDECSGFYQQNHLVNISDSNAPDWAAMNAMIGDIDEDCDNGTTTVQIAPPPHLSAESLIELLRATYTARPSLNYNDRATGKQSNTPVVNQMQQGPKAASARAGDPGPALPWAPVNNYDGTISLNPKSLLYNFDGVNVLAISNLAAKFNPALGWVVYLKVPLTSGIDVDPAQSISLVLASAGTLPNYPVGLNTSDLANVYQNWVYINLLQFVATNDPRPGDLWMWSNGVIFKVIQLAKTDLRLFGCRVMNQAISGAAFFPISSPGTIP